MNRMIIRDANTKDSNGILAIYEPLVQETSISFETSAPTSDEMARRIEQSTWRWPWLVAEQDGQIAGYAYARPFRMRSAYQFTAESTVYVGQSFQRQGVGNLLMQHLLNRLYSAGHHLVVAGVALPNNGSVALHERLGYEPVGVFRSVGRKFQSWHDVGFWSLELSDQTVTLPKQVAMEWRMRACSATSEEANVLIRQLTDDIASRYDHKGDGGASSFIAEDFDEHRGAFIVGWLHNEPVACGAIRPLKKDVAELKRMFVAPHHRGKKLSSQILKRLEFEASRLEYRTVCLETGNRQPEAIKLYEKAGYQEIPRFGRYVENANSICFEKPIQNVGCSI